MTTARNVLGFTATACAAAVMLSLAAGSLMAQPGFTPLTYGDSGTTWNENGEAKDGWVKRGGDATFAVENGDVVGRRGDGPNTFLCSTRMYENFVLHLECKFDLPCNSGIQFRSNARRDGNSDRETVFGYQCELDQDQMTGGIYDESRRNRWVDPLTAERQARCVAAFKKGEWNSLTIQCVGPSIKTWLNGELISDLFDIEEQRGFIALQVHSGDQGVVRWRRLRIKELPSTPWERLYADGFFGAVELKPVGLWSVMEDGGLRGVTPEGEPRDGMVLSQKSYKDFAVKVSYKMETGNSGLYFRATEIDKPYWLKGFQCEIAGGAADAGLWEVEGRGWVENDKKHPKTAEFVRSGEWNTIATVAVGDHLATFLNGNNILDVVDPACAKEGKTGLQLHGGGSQGCCFNRYYVMPLSAAMVQLIAQDKPAE